MGQLFQVNIPDDVNAVQDEHDIASLWARRLRFGYLFKTDTGDRPLG